LTTFGQHKWLGHHFVVDKGNDDITISLVERLAKRRKVRAVLKSNNSGHSQTWQRCIIV
jgi:ABC-type branched-subunit amino acid transport system substrate-binding protein